MSSPPGRASPRVCVRRRYLGGFVGNFRRHFEMNRQSRTVLGFDCRHLSYCSNLAEMDRRID